MIKLKTLLPEAITQSDWPTLIGKELVLTGNIKLTPREVRPIIVTAKVGETITVEATPYQKQPNIVTVSYKGTLYTANVTSVLSNSNIKINKR